MSSNLVVRYRNEINRASHTLSTIESRIVLTAIAQVPAGEVSEKEIYWVNASDLKDLGTSPTKVYARMKEAAHGLFNRYITLPKHLEENIETVTTFRWIQSVRYQDGRIGIRFSSEILPFISHIQTEFTKYNLIEIKGFTYSTTRIYSMLSQYVDTGFFTISIPDLRLALELENQYKAYADLKRYILSPALKHINSSETSRLKVTMKEKKVGRRVEQLFFTIKIKDPDIYDAEIDVDTGDLFAEGLSRSQAELSPQQIDTFGDILSGQNKKFSKIAEDFYYDCHRKELLNWECYNKKQCTENLKKKLTDPDFVIAIYPWLKKVGFVFH